MTSPIFARTRHHYDSYQDFWRLVELSGFEVCFVDEMDLGRDVLYVTTPFNGEHRPHIERERARTTKRAKVVWWNLERPDAPPRRATTETNDDVLRYVDEIWCSDLHYRSLDPRMRFVVLGSHRCLAAYEGASRPTPVYDYALLAAPAGRRYELNGALVKRGLTGAPNAWGTPRTIYLYDTAVLVNVHQHVAPAPIAEPLRFAVGAAHGMALVSETVADVWPLVKQADLVSVGYDQLPDAVLNLCDPKHAATRIAMGETLYKRLCVEWPFRRGVEESLR